MKSLVLCLVFIWGVRVAFCGAAYCQEKADEEGGLIAVDTITTGLKNAMEQFDLQKAQERDEEEKRLQAELNTFADGWLNGKRAERQAQLKRVIDAVWQDIATDTQQDFYVYYLRDFACSIKDMDLVRQESAIYPYKAAVVVRELLYVEREPLIAEPRTDYEYTVDTDITLNLQYNKEQGKWQLLDTPARRGVLIKGWPEDIRKKVGIYFVPPEG